MRDSGRLAFLVLLGLTACGEVNSVRLNLVFENPATEAEVRAVQVIVREVVEPSQTACLDFVDSAAPPGVGERREVLAFPLDQDLLLDVALTQYEQLTLILLAFPSTAIDQTTPVAGSCDVVDIPSEGAARLDFALVDLGQGTR